LNVIESARGDVKDAGLAQAGRSRIAWAGSFMPVLGQIRERFAKEQPLRGVRIGACLHVTSETANLMLALKAGGAQIALCASNPLSTQDDVAAALMSAYEIPTFAIKGEDNATYYRHIEAVIATKPQLSMDDGCDLVTSLTTKHQDLLSGMIGGCEETTTGVIRLRAMQKDGVLPYPVIAVNDALTKHMFDNRDGPVDARRDRPRDEYPLGRLDRGRERLRLVRARRRLARERAGRARDRHGNRSAQGDRGGHGRFHGDADQGSRQGRRRVRYRHR
jgi:adenosylhomocysteinase